MSKNFYITTTAPYVNAEPHIGFALEIIQADVIARYQRLQGKKVFFNTGTDEHGVKIYRQALKAGKRPQDFVDENAAKFDGLKKALDLSCDNFTRTTEEYHKKAAQEFWRRCDQNNDIYKAKQKIKYCIGCELEKTDSELEDGWCPLHPNKKIEILEEENYFFRFSKYQQPLLNFYQKNPNFVVPAGRFKEIKNFIAQGLKDFSISRLKDKLPWGVEVPGDKDHVMYVWFDALIYYISALGWPENIMKFKKWWPGMQCAGKDNLRQQSAMWQAMLMSAGLPNSTKVLIHGFITSNGQKMSKSLGNVVDPVEMVKKYGTEAVRYYLLREISPTKDGDFSYSRFEEVYNADLANGLGNLVQRVARLAERAGLGDLKSKKNEVVEEIDGFMQKFEFHEALELIWQKIASLDKLINDEEPWKKEGKELNRFLKTVISEILKTVVLLKPFLSQTANNIEEIFTAEKIKMPKRPLFPRING